VTAACPNALRVTSAPDRIDTPENTAWCDQPAGHDGPHSCSQDGYSVAWTRGGDVTWSAAS
jgi:hypothetical protein